MVVVLLVLFNYEIIYMKWAHQCLKSRLRNLSPVPRPLSSPRRGWGCDIFLLILCRDKVVKCRENIYFQLELSFVLLRHIIPCCDITLLVTFSFCCDILILCCDILKLFRDISNLVKFSAFLVRFVSFSFKTHKTQS